MTGGRISPMVWPMQDHTTTVQENTMIRRDSLSKFAPRAVAVVAAIGLVGAGSATGASLITGKQIKNRTVGAKDIKRKAIGLGHLTPAAVAALKGATGPAGPKGDTGAKGDTGPKGDTGAQGERGPSDVFATAIGGTNAPNSMDVIDTLDLPAGKYAITATVTGASLAGSDHTLSCRLANDGGELASGDDFYATADGRANITLITAVELDGFTVNSNDVTLECTDNNTSVIVTGTMNAVKVASITAA